MKFIIVLKVLANAIRQEERKGIWIRKEEIKVSVSIVSMFFYVENYLYKNVN